MAMPNTMPKLVYSQSTGVMLLDSMVVGTGYSGYGKFKNSPDDEALVSRGPIPRGTYTVGLAFKHPSAGPLTMRLVPYKHIACGRYGFLIHGDNTQTMGDSSHGCIVLPRPARQIISDLGKASLEVIR